jgi:asparagine synthase (glutamine-hydrolysing)
MPLCGIVTPNQGQPMDAVALKRMIAASALDRNWTSVQLDQPTLGFGGTSPAQAVSVCRLDGLIVACDADIANQADLASTLSSSKPISNAAELVGSLYQKKAISFLKRIRGSFSLAIWDEKENQLLLAVDPFGVRPLCYAGGPEQITFASYPGALFQSGCVEKRVDPRAIASYLNFYVVLAPQCAFAGISKVLPGSVVFWKAGSVRTERYWDLQYTEDARSSTDRLACELLALMDDSVRTYSVDRAGAQLGCFLSGGTDSSSIAGLLARSGKRPVQTFSIGFGEDRFNELEYAHIAARHFQTQHRESVLTPEETLRIIPKVVAAFDEPFANASAIPTYFCSSLAKNSGVDVMLAGDGGDELFGGNSRYSTDKIFQLYHEIPALLRRWLIEPAVDGFPISFGLLEKARRYIRRANAGHPDRGAEYQPLRYFPPELVLAPGMPYRNGHEDVLAIPRAYHRDAPAHSELNRQLYVDIKITLGDNDLPKVVRTAEMAGINVRFPYLDPPLADFSGRLPANLKLRGFEKRYLFKRATRDLLPEAILKKKKHGFGLPIGVWVKSDPKLRSWAEDVLHDPRTYQRGYFQREFVERLFKEMDLDNSSTFFGDMMWLFLMLELWHRQHVEGN